MNQVELKKVESKIYFHPGFWEGLMEVTSAFTLENDAQLTKIWDGVANYLRNYEYTLTELSKNGVSVFKIHPFISEDDLAAARLIISNYWK